MTDQPQSEIAMRAAREQFEKWAADANLDLRRSTDHFPEADRKKYPGALYVMSVTNWAWESWQAALDSSPRLVGRADVLEEAAKVADYHHDNHCTNHDTEYHNCGMAIATGIRDLKLNPASGLSELQRELARAVDARTHTQDWYARHYGKLEDWARKRLPDPWANEFFHCVANGTWGHDDVGEPYMSQVGKIVPSGYFKMDTAAEQLLRDQTKRAQDAESRAELAEQSSKELAVLLQEFVSLANFDSGTLPKTTMVAKAETALSNYLARKGE